MAKNFIAKIQNADEETKKLWLFVLSGATMAAVVALWLVYMNFAVPRVEPPALADENPPAALPAVATAHEGPGFFSIFAAGAKTIYDGVKSKIASATNNILIENPEHNFQAEDVGAIPETKLP